MSKRTFEMTMLLDFYGELLTEKQRGCVGMYYNEDLSLSEIAEIMDISRQGVRDLLVRAEGTLTDTEAKIGLLRRFSEQRAVLENISVQLASLEKLTTGKANELCRSLREDLGRISL